MTVYETDVPGVGHKYELELGGDERLIVLIHHDGKREVYLRPDADADSEKLFSLSGTQANQLGSILEGAYFDPVDLSQTQVPLGEAIIEWVDMDADSPLVGGTLGESDLRNETGVSIIAIQRGPDTIANPGPETTIETDDILVMLGTREEHQAVERLHESDE